MEFRLDFYGAAEQVTGSLYVVRAGHSTVLLECGLIQGSKAEEARNNESFPVPVDDIDAVVLSHAHIDHSGRVPLLTKLGYKGPVFAQHATHALCKIMLPDSGYLNEKDVEWENKRRERKNQEPLDALYSKEDGEKSLKQFQSIDYDEKIEIVPDLWLRYFDAGHILGSAIVELTYDNGAESKTLVFSGDLGYRDAPVMNSPKICEHADAVMMESTYGDRLHRPFAETIEEIGDLFAAAHAGRGNILIPAFTVGRTQDILYLMAENYDAWGLEKWHIYLDSPMAIRATETYAQYRTLFGADLFAQGSSLPNLPNFHASLTTQESMAINVIQSGAVIIAGSGMCSGGRIHHHLKNNIWRPECHVAIVGYQAHGTLGRRIVDGVDEIKLWGQKYPVRAKVHTIGGLSAHADQADLLDWFGGFKNSPPVYLVHGEPHAQNALVTQLQAQYTSTVSIAKYKQSIVI